MIDTVGEEDARPGVVDGEPVTVADSLQDSEAEGEWELPKEAELDIEVEKVAVLDGEEDSEALSVGAGWGRGRDAGPGSVHSRIQRANANTGGSEWGVWGHWHPQ